MTSATDIASAFLSAPLPLPFPFAAIAGQPQLREALLLAAVDPGLGGVLIEGPRGTAKSTAARALAELLPGAPFVTLPLGASLEHLVGTLDLGRALAGHEVAFSPGLLARAHGGVLYVDEVNLLPDALIDSLLDVAASGVNHVERDGISHRHAARFVLVGTMNPEEGELRPQLLDRFGLCVRVHNIDDAKARRDIVRARLAFDVDPIAFRESHAAAQDVLAANLVRARARVADRQALPYGDEVHAVTSALCMDAHVDGLRADLVMLRAARALAAWDDAPEITADHVQRVAESVLLHRRKEEQEHVSPSSPQPKAAPQRPATSPSTQSQQASAGATGGEGIGNGNDPDHSNGDSDDSDWGAMLPGPVGIERVKQPRPLMARTSPPASPKKA